MTNSIKKIAVTSALALVSVLVSASLVSAATFTPLTTHLGVGSTGTNVTNLQTFLASNYDIYPSGRVTGYYGGLTSSAVQQFQLAYGIQTLGNVGPATFSKINSVIAMGYGIDIYAPTIYNTSVSKTNSSATFSWATTENATGKVYYSTSPFAFAEAVGNFTEPTILGGSTMSSNYMQTTQNVTISNLQSNTLYYYVIEAVDASGNVSVTQQSTIITN
jgi:peptidoglycan hydrolase-like protein with peptidoglycan-binding domain